MDEKRRASGAQEKRVAKTFGAKQHGGSGSGWMRRNDSHTDEELFECKTVLGGKRQITVKADDLLQVERQAVAEGRVPVLHIELAKRRYVLLTEEDYAEMRSNDRKAKDS